MKTPQRTGMCSSKIDHFTARILFDFHYKKYLFQICLLKIHIYLILSCVELTEFLEAAFLIYFALKIQMYTENMPFLELRLHFI